MEISEVWNRGQGFQVLGSLVLSDMSELSLSYGFRFLFIGSVVDTHIG